MKVYSEKLNPLSNKIRKELLEKLGKSEYGQALREELVDLINSTSSVRNISKEIIEGDANRLSIEVVARDNAVYMMEELYRKVTPLEVKSAMLKARE